MKIEDVTRIIKKQVAQKGYVLEERKSVSTDSWYFKIYSGDCSLLFRISDHKTKSDIITLRLDKKTTQKTVEGFIINRCKDLSDRKLKMLLGL